MAHLIVMASMPPCKVAEIAAPEDICAFASRTAFCSHLVIDFCPKVAQALDGGEPLMAGMWHPVRGPAVHSPEWVPRALARLETAARDISRKRTAHSEWIAGELSQAIELYRHASAHGESVVSMLDLTRSEEER